MSVEALNCKECGERYPLDARFVCERCFVPLEVEYDLTGLDHDETRRRIQAGPATIWRYADFLPFETRPRTALAAGVTPLVRADRLAERLGVREIWVKNDAANPKTRSRTAWGRARWRRPRSSGTRAGAA